MDEFARTNAIAALPKTSILLQASPFGEAVGNISNMNESSLLERNARSPQDAQASHQKPVDIIDVKRQGLTRNWMNGQKEEAKLRAGPDGFCIAMVGSEQVTAEVPNLAIAKFPPQNKTSRASKTVWTRMRLRKKA